MKNTIHSKKNKIIILVLMAVACAAVITYLLKSNLFRYGYASDGTKIRNVYEITAGNKHIAYAKSRKDAKKISDSLIKDIEKRLRIETTSNNLKTRKMKLKLTEHPKVPDVKTAIEKADTKNITAESLFTEDDVKYYATVEKESDDYRKGIRAVSVVGQNGIARNTYSAKIANNEIKETKLVSSETVEQPVNEIVLIGTAKISKNLNETGGNISADAEVSRKAQELQYIPCAETENIEQSETYKRVQEAGKWDGNILTRNKGAISNGPHGRETYYNLNMSGVVSIMRGMGNNDPYWVRSDGVKMLGYYAMVAANFDKYPRGSIIQSSVGPAIVTDTGSFRFTYPDALDIAVNW